MHQPAGTPVPHKETSESVTTGGYGHFWLDLRPNHLAKTETVQDWSQEAREQAPSERHQEVVFSMEFFIYHGLFTQIIDQVEVEECFIVGKIFKDVLFFNFFRHGSLD